MERDYKKEFSYKAAQKKVKDIKGFYVHLLIFIVINSAILVLSTRDTGFIQGLTEWSNYSTIFFWGIGLLAHWAGVFGPNIMFGKNWEEKKIRELMDKDKKQLWK
ncbi:2TM domain-containing protein [Pontixanthobacter gangjinensis]|uniref:2TM domain-containing protein n=1 Tax=Christiangramia aestuarii TaxID=1028746 RepID=A0A7K1LP23_9FLAO|nr:2TM domain-containing protein [Christiangramia aestuarii]MUP42537.1 2TM domain-containing protein [Christiangramia aestuarii]